MCDSKGSECIVFFFFFFQAEDGIRDIGVTGVQTCALPISDIGTFFSIAALADLIFTYLLRKSFDTISPNKCMALDWLTESWPVLIFALASTKMQFFIGAIAQKITNVLNPAYRVYENAIFKEDKRSKIYTYHLFIPEIATVIIFPILGYILDRKSTRLNSSH